MSPFWKTPTTAAAAFPVDWTILMLLCRLLPAVVFKAYNCWPVGLLDVIIWFCWRLLVLELPTVSWCDLLFRRKRRLYTDDFALSFSTFSINFCLVSDCDGASAMKLLIISWGLEACLLRLLISAAVCRCCFISLLLCLRCAFGLTTASFKRVFLGEDESSYFRYQTLFKSCICRWSTLLLNHLLLGCWPDAILGRSL